MLTATSAVDYIICGEGEATLRVLLQTLEAGGNPDDIPGLAFRRREEIVTTAPQIVTGSIDALPTAWDLLEWPEYKYFVLPGSRLGAINSLRVSGDENAKQIRYRDPHLVVEEIVHLHETYSVDVILITDDFPTDNGERWELFLDLLIARAIPVRLLMQTSAADIIRDQSFLWKYRKAGVVHMYLAIEATYENLDDFSSSGTVSDAKLALDIIREHGIISEASFVIGGPDETKAGTERTLKLAQYCNPDNVQFLPFTPWPGDRAYDAARQYVKVHDYAKYNLIDPVVEPKQMSLNQVDSVIMNFHRRFYMGKMMEIITMADTFKRDYLMRAMKLLMVNPFILKKLGMGPLGKVSAKIGGMMHKEKF